MITPPSNLKKTMRRRYILQQLVMMSSPREIGGVSIGRSGGNGGGRSYQRGRGIIDLWSRQMSGLSYRNN